MIGNKTRNKGDFKLEGLLVYLFFKESFRTSKRTITGTFYSYFREVMFI